MSKIKFKSRCELELVDEFDEGSDSLGSFNQIFNEGEDFEVDIIRKGTKSMDVQFGDGSMSYNVWFELAEIV